MTLDHYTDADHDRAMRKLAADLEKITPEQVEAERRRLEEEGEAADASGSERAVIVNEPYEPYPEIAHGCRAFGQTLRFRRIQAGVTLRKCAERMGISPTQLSYIEQGRRLMSDAERDAFERAIA